MFKRVFRTFDMINGALFAFALGCILAFGQKAGVAQEQTFLEEDYLGGIAFEKRVEERLNRDIAIYLGHSRFIIRVNADIYDSKRKLEIPRGVTPRQLPPIVEESLPGLPFPEILPGEEEFVPVRRDPLLESFLELLPSTKVIKRIYVTFMVDRNITAEQEEFIRNLVFQKLSLDVSRGDGFEIVKTDFPGTSISEKMQRDEFIIPMVGILLLVLLAIIFGIVFFKMVSSHRRRKVEEAQKSKLVEERTLEVEADEKKRAEIEEERRRAGLKRKKEQLRQEIINLGVGQPKLLNDRLKEELESAEGIKKGSMIFTTLGFGLAKNIFQELPPEKIIEIETFLKENPEIDEEELIGYLEQFHTDTMNSLLFEGRKEKKSRPFSFLGELDSSQLTYLVKEEEIKVGALILSQLPPKSAAEVLRNLSLEQQSEIAFELAKFDTIPISAFQPVAQRLAKKAIEVPSMETLTTDGLGIIVSVMDFMDIGSQTLLLDRLKKENPQMYQRIKKVFFTFSDIPRVPKSVLKDAVRDVERDVLARCLVNADREVIAAIMRSLNEEARRIVTDEYKLVGKEVSVEEVDAARVRVVENIRGYLKSGIFSMEDLEKSSESIPADTDKPKD